VSVLRESSRGSAIASDGESMPRKLFVIELQNPARRRAITARTLAIKERMCCLNRQSLGGGVG
jgi:hypothetical protein